MYTCCIYTNVYLQIKCNLVNLLTRQEGCHFLLLYVHSVYYSFFPFAYSLSVSSLPCICTTTTTIIWSAFLPYRYCQSDLPLLMLQLGGSRTPPSYPILVPRNFLHFGPLTIQLAGSVQQMPEKSKLSPSAYKNMPGFLTGIQNS
jgi:hypothetical protein